MSEMKLRFGKISLIQNIQARISVMCSFLTFVWTILHYFVYCAEGAFRPTTTKSIRDPLLDFDCKIPHQTYENTSKSSKISLPAVKTLFFAHRIV